MEFILVSVFSLYMLLKILLTFVATISAVRVKEQQQQQQHHNHLSSMPFDEFVHTALYEPKKLMAIAESDKN